MPNICCVCNEATADLVSLKFKNEAQPILDKLREFIDITVSIQWRFIEYLPHFSWIKTL